MYIRAKQSGLGRRLGNLRGRQGLVVGCSSCTGKRQLGKRLGQVLDTDGNQFFTTDALPGLFTSSPSATSPTAAPTYSSGIIPVGVGSGGNPTTTDNLL